MNEDWFLKIISLCMVGLLVVFTLFIGSLVIYMAYSAITGDTI